MGWGELEKVEKVFPKKSLLHLPKDILYEEVMYYQIEFTYGQKEMLKKKISHRGCREVSWKSVFPRPDVCTTRRNKSCMCVSREFPIFFSSVAEAFFPFSAM